MTTDLFSSLDTLALLGRKKAEKNLREAGDYLKNDFKGIAQILRKYNPLELLKMAAWEERKVLLSGTKDSVKRAAASLLPTLVQSVLVSDEVDPKALGTSNDIKAKDWERLKNLGLDVTRRIIWSIDNKAAAAMADGILDKDDADMFRDAFAIRLLPEDKPLDKIAEFTALTRSLLEEMPGMEEETDTDFVTLSINLDSISRHGSTGIDELVEDITRYKEEFDLAEAKLRLEGKLDGLSEADVYRKVTEVNHWEGRVLRLAGERDGYDLFRVEAASDLPTKAFMPFTAKIGSVDLMEYVEKGFWPVTEKPFVEVGGILYSFVAKHTTEYIYYTLGTERTRATRHDLLVIFEHNAGTDVYTYDGNNVDITILPSVLDFNALIDMKAFGIVLRKRHEEYSVKKTQGHKRVIVDTDSPIPTQKLDEDTLLISASYLYAATIDKTRKKELLSTLFGTLVLPEGDMGEYVPEETEEEDIDFLSDDETTDEYEYEESDEDSSAKAIDEKYETIEDAQATLVAAAPQEDISVLTEKYSIPEEILKRDEEIADAEEEIRESLDDDIFDDSEEMDSLDDIGPEAKADDEEFYDEVDSLDEYEAEAEEAKEEDEESEENSDEDSAQLDFFAILDDDQDVEAAPAPAPAPKAEAVLAKVEEPKVEEPKTEESQVQEEPQHAAPELPKGFALADFETDEFDDSEPASELDYGDALVNEMGIEDETDDTEDEENEVFEAVEDEYPADEFETDDSDGDEPNEDEPVVDPIQGLVVPEDDREKQEPAPDNADDYEPVEELDDLEEDVFDSTMNESDSDEEALEDVDQELDSLDTEEASTEETDDEDLDSVDVELEDADDTEEESEEEPEAEEPEAEEPEAEEPEAEEELEETGVAGVLKDKDGNFVLVDETSSIDSLLNPQETPKKEPSKPVDFIAALLGEDEDDEDEVPVEEIPETVEEEPLEEAAAEPEPAEEEMGEEPKKESKPVDFFSALLGDVEEEEENPIDVPAVEEEPEPEVEPVHIPVEGTSLGEDGNYTLSSDSTFSIPEATEPEDEVEEDETEARLDGILLSIYRHLGKGSQFASLVSESDDDTLNDLSDVVKNCWNRQQVDQKDKLFSISERSLSIMLSKDEVRDDLRLSELLNNAGGVMYSKREESWTAVIVSIDSDYEVVKALEKNLSKDSFSASDWKRVTYIGEQLRARSGN